MVPKNTDSPVIANGILLEDIRGLIESAKSRFAQTANAALVTLYWNVGNRIKTDILGNERAQYGRLIVHALSAELTAEYGKGFSEKTLRRMIQFAEVFPDQQIVVSLTRQLSWTHFVALIHMKDPLQREFYAEKSYEHVELLRLEEGGMYVAEYLTDLPPRRLLEAKLHEAIRLAREQIAVREGAE
jgi:hypothetical protein